MLMYKIMPKLRAFCRTSLVLFLVLSFGYSSQAQVDPHFSQYYVYPSWLNPALTGAFDGTYRVSGIYRNQWKSVSTPFATPGIALDFATDKNLNIGGSFLNQTAGEGGYVYTTGYANFAYTGVRFGTNDQQRLVFGLQLGFIQKRFNPSKMTFGDQWNAATGFDPSAVSGDIANVSNVRSSAFDAGAGVMYFDAAPGKKANLFAGYSASHLTRPEDKFFGANSNGRTPVRHTIHAGVRIGLSNNFSLTPNALFLKQGTATETMLGATGTVKLNDQTDFMLGANYRFKDAFSPFIGVTFNNFLLSAAYDVNTSDLGRMVNGTSSYEISLTYIGRRSVKTPEVEFVCPRL